MHFPSNYTVLPGCCFKAFHSLAPSESRTKNSKKMTKSIPLNPSLFPPFPLLWALQQLPLFLLAKGVCVNGAELGCVYQDLFGNAQIQTALLMSNLTGVSLFTEMLAHLVLPLVKVFCCLFNHIVLSSFPIQKMKQGRNMGGLCVEGAEGQETQQRLRKARFSWSVLQILFSFLISRLLDYIVLQSMASVLLGNFMK